MKRDASPKAERQYDASLDIWHSMGYFVAKELGLRPMSILTTWSCEELLVAYGVYANAQSKEAYDCMPKAERRKKNLSYLDRWAIPFFSKAQLEELSSTVAEENQSAEEMAKIADALFS